MSIETGKSAAERLEKIARELGEQFDTVSIFVTQYEPEELDGTRHVEVGVGNWYARYGQVKEWVIRQEEEARESVGNERDEE